MGVRAAVCGKYVGGGDGGGGARGRGCILLIAFSSVTHVHVKSSLVNASILVVSIASLETH